MSRKYLAYTALLAGWIILCYWLYANRIAPYVHHSHETSSLEMIEDLAIPFAFRWGSAVPVAGRGFDAWSEQCEDIDSTDEVVVLRGHFFRDERDSLTLSEQLARERLKNAMVYLRPDPERMLMDIGPQEINADVRRFPFAAVEIERYPIAEVIRYSDDTLEVCFPLRDSLSLPGVVRKRLESWLQEKSASGSGAVYLTGTADGTGIAESSDEALDRANVIYELLLQYGWQADSIHLTTGQRNHPLALHNRCVIMYFEK